MPVEKRGRAAHAAAWTLVVVAAGGCAGPRVEVAPPIAPKAAAHVRSFAGSPLSGPQARPPWLMPDECDPRDAWRVEVAWFVAQEVPTGLGVAPLVEWTRLVVVEPDLEPRFGPSLLTRGGRVGLEPDAAAAADELRGRVEVLALTVQEGVLPPGVTTAFELTEASLTWPAGLPDVDEHEERPARLALLLHRPGPTAPPPLAPGRRSTTLEAGAPRPRAQGPAGIRAALGELAGLAHPAERRPQGPLAVEVALDVQARAPGAAAHGRPAPPRRELVLVGERLPVGPGALVVAVPSPFTHPRRSGGGWLLAVMRVRPAPRPGEPEHAAHREAYAAALAEIERTCALWQPPPGELSRPGVLVVLPQEAARVGLKDPAQQRRILLGLADATGADLTRMLALTADRADIQRISLALSDRLGAPGAPAAGPALRWLLERTTVGALREGFPLDAPPPALASVIGRFAGAAAHRASFIELFDAARDAEHLDALLARENVALLDDSSAAIRARAAEWLASRRPELLPPGYHPLAPDRQRRAALRRLGDPFPDEDEPEAAGAEEEGR
ncbi:MAG: hypothetical protein M9894_01910 [Planctomycetes bacterium]|nr:hypothetical protein [Planctomycetota bacterium]